MPNQKKKNQKKKAPKKNANKNSTKNSGQNEAKNTENDVTEKIDLDSLNSAIEGDAVEFVKIIEIEGKGRGMVAKKNIPKMTEILKVGWPRYSTIRYFLPVFENFSIIFF